MGVIISTDSACDLFPDLYKQYQIDVVSLYITIEEHSYRDVFEIGPDELFVNYEKTHRLPKTSAPPPADFFTMFKKHVDNGDDVVHIAMNSKFSSSYQNACTAAKEFDNVYVVDTFTLSSAQGLLVLRAADMRDAGMSAKKIFDQIEIDKTKMRTNVLGYLGVCLSRRQGYTAANVRGEPVKAASLSAAGHARRTDSTQKVSR